MRTFAQKQNQPQQKSSANLTRSNALAPAASHGTHALLNVQRTLGNQAVPRLLRARADGLEAGFDTEVDAEIPATARFAHDFSRIPAHAKAPIMIQPKLTVNTPGDIYEQEADRVAEQAISTREPMIRRQVHPPNEREDEQASRIGQSADRDLSPLHTLASSEGSPLFHEVLNSSGQPLDSNTRAFFEPRFGHDFSHVRVHNDANADTAARAVNARAFTIGGDVVFASGEFRTETPAGRRLLAHELGHVIQQSGGSHAGEGSPDLHAAEPSIQRYVQTLGGRWDTTKYELVFKEQGRDVTGLDIALNFTPEDPVDAELIGLTQIVRVIHQGKPLFNERWSKQRATPKGEEGVESGFHIDRPEGANPLYAAGEASAQDTLASTPIAPPGMSLGDREVRSSGQHGWHYRDATGTPQHQDAILIDKPLFRIPAPNSGQTFETTALAIKGRQEGTYYGSVKWGFETDQGGTLTALPLSIVAAGVPSATFMRAAELWNEATTSKGAETIDLPTANLPSSAIMPVRRSAAGLAIEIARISKELASMSPGTAKTNKEFEKTALEFALAKRRDKPTISMADQETAAAMLPTSDLIKRAAALTDEITKGEPLSGSATNKQLEWDAVMREIPKRKLLVTVHVHATGDVLSDNVYVEAPNGAQKWSSSVNDLNSGEENTFVAPLSSVFPALSLDPRSSPLLIEVYDEDVGEDDLMFTKTWHWSDLPAGETQSRSGGKYTVRVDFAQP